MWIPGIEPGHEDFQTSALPTELNPRQALFERARASAANGNRTHDLSVDNRALIPLSYGDDAVIHFSKNDKISITSEEGEGFEPSRPEGLPVFETGALPVQPTLRITA